MTRDSRHFRSKPALPRRHSRRSTRFCLLRLAARDRSSEARFEILLTVAHSTLASKEQSISAFPMGSRIGLNPWTSQVDLLKSKPRALVSSQKRQPLLINPSIPHLVLQSTEGPEQQGKSVPTDSSKRAKIGRNGSVGFGHDAGNLST